MLVYSYTSVPDCSRKMGAIITETIASILWCLLLIDLPMDTVFIYVFVDGTLVFCYSVTTQSYLGA